MNKEPIVIIVNALIWGLVLVACSMALNGTVAYQEIQIILGGGAAASLFVLAVGLRTRQRE